MVATENYSTLSLAILLITVRDARTIRRANRPCKWVPEPTVTLLRMVPSTSEGSTSTQHRMIVIASRVRRCPKNLSIRRIHLLKTLTSVWLLLCRQHKHDLLSTRSRVNQLGVYFLRLRRRFGPLSLSRRQSLTDSYPPTPDRYNSIFNARAVISSLAAALFS